MLKQSTSRRLGISFLLVPLILIGFFATVQVANAGVVYNWQPTTSYPLMIEGTMCAESSGYLFCFGGYNGTYTTDAVYYAPISASGVGAWTQTTNIDSPSNIAMSFGSCLVVSGYVYCIGGAGVAVFTAQLSSSGATNWQRTTNYPANIISGLPCVSYSSFLTCIGGNNGAGPTNAVYNNSLSGGAVGATWSSSTNYPENIESGSCVSYSGYVYCIGGYNGTATLSNVYYAQLGTGGGITGSWLSTTSYPTPIQLESCVTDSSTVYCIGGSNGTVANNVVYFAPLLSTGGIGAGGWQRAIYPNSTEGSSCVYDSTNQNVICVGGGSSRTTPQSAVNYAPIEQPSTTTSTVTSISTSTQTVSSTSVSTTTATATTTQTSTNTQTITSTVTTPVTSTATVTSSATTTFTQSASTLTQTVTSTVTSSATQTVTSATVSTVTSTSASSLLVQAYSSGGVLVSNVMVTLANSSGFSSQVNTNSSGDAFFSGLTRGATYTVSATIEGVKLSAPVTLSGSGGTAIVVLEPNQPSSSSTTVSTMTTSSSSSSSPSSSSPTSNSAGLYEIGAVVVIVVVIVGLSLLFLRRPR